MKKFVSDIFFIIISVLIKLFVFRIILTSVSSITVAVSADQCPHVCPVREQSYLRNTCQNRNNGGSFSFMNIVEGKFDNECTIKDPMNCYKPDLVSRISCIW